MTALVTGGTGFVGSHLVEELLRRGDRVRCLVRDLSRPSWLSGTKAELVAGDVTNRDSIVRALPGARVVYHAAGVTKEARRGDFERVNAGGAENLLRSVAELRGRPPRVVLVSSLAAVGPSPAGLPVGEEGPLAPVSRYGRSKAAGEAIARAYADRVPISIVRGPIIYGPRDRDAADVFRMIPHGWFFRPGWVRRRFSLVFVRDFVSALVEAARRGQTLAPNDLARGVYAPADPTPYTFDDMARAAGDAFHRRVRIVAIPEGVVAALASVSGWISRVTGKPSIVNPDKARENRAGDWICDSSRTNRELRLPLATSLAEGFRVTAEWYRRAGWLPG